MEEEDTKRVSCCDVRLLLASKGCKASIAIWCPSLSLCYVLDQKNNLNSHIVFNGFRTNNKQSPLNVKHHFLFPEEAAALTIQKKLRVIAPIETPHHTRKGVSFRQWCVECWENWESRSHQLAILDYFFYRFSDCESCFFDVAVEADYDMFCFNDQLSLVLNACGGSMRSGEILEALCSVRFDTFEVYLDLALKDYRIFRINAWTLAFALKEKRCGDEELEKSIMEMKVEAEMLIRIAGKVRHRGFDVYACCRPSKAFSRKKILVPDFLLIILPNEETMVPESDFFIELESQIKPSLIVLSWKAREGSKIFYWKVSGAQNRIEDQADT